MPGIRNREYKDGIYRFWYKDRNGDRGWGVGTKSRAVTLGWAHQKEELERKIREGLAMAPGSVEVNSHRPIAEVTDEYLAWGNAQGGRGGRKWGKDHARKRQDHLAWWNAWLDLDVLGDLVGSLPQVEAGQSDLRRRKLACKTIKNYTEALVSFCKWCVDREYLAEHPLKRMGRLDATPEARNRAFTSEEIRRLLGVSPPHRRILYETAIKSGLRANELRNLKPKHLDLARGRINLDAEWTKARKDQYVHVDLELLARLREYGMSRTAERLYGRYYTDPRKRPVDPLLFVPKNTTRDLEPDLKAAGIEKYTEEGRAVFHSFRTTFATLLAETGVSVKVIQDQLRHSTPDMSLNIYCQPTYDGLNKAAVNLSRSIDGPEECAERVPALAVVGGDVQCNGMENKGLRLVSFGAEGGIRTPTPLRALDPEPSASANSATSARKEAKI